MPKALTAYVVRECKYTFEVPDEMTSEDEGFTDLLYEATGHEPESFVNQSMMVYDNGTWVY